MYDCRACNLLQAMHNTSRDSPRTFRVGTAQRHGALPRPLCQWLPPTPPKENSGNRGPWGLLCITPGSAWFCEVGAASAARWGLQGQMLRAHLLLSSGLCP